MSLQFGVIFAIIILLAVFLLLTYNRLIAMRNTVRNAWSDIDVQLTRRHDLVPNLVESVKGYMGHERETLEAVTKARAQAVAGSGGASIATRVLAETVLGQAVSNLMVTAERYPELKASDNFLMLQEQLTSTENRIAFARQHYNDSVRRFNTAIAEFPKNLIAGALGFIAEPLFAADASDRAVAQVQV
ncbi:MAG TPA: LemA family protein [Candidatus Limnocylindrales bacterium]|jgi:LemA protein|nr:LemA family protein [Candidatus Limnocylindrales bacterium]